MQVPYAMKTLKEAELLIDIEQPLFCDTETCGFYGKVRLLQLMQKDWSEAILVEWPEPYSMAAFLDQYSTKWHNAHYDITTIQEQTETRWEPKSYDCTFLLSRLAYPAKETIGMCNHSS